MKVTPYALGETLLLNVEQIIPTPEAKELMIGMSIKEAQEKTTEVALHNRHKLRREFWTTVGMVTYGLQEASRIQCSHAVEGFDKANWPVMIAWLVEHLSLLEGPFKGALQGGNRDLKGGIGEL